MRVTKVVGAVFGVALVLGLLALLAAPARGAVDPLFNVQQQVTVTSASAPGNATSTPMTGLGNTHSCEVVAVLAGNTGGNLDVYLQDSKDGGTTWVDYAHFPQISAAGSGTYRLAFSKSAPTTTIVVSGSAVIAANTMVGGDYGDRLRILAVSGASTSAGAVQTVSITCSL